jgi:predicted dehydrogenase
LKKESRLLRIGVLGCGPIAQAAHFDACRKARNVELYAICDIAGDLVKRMAAIHQPHTVYTDYAQMLADPELEAVIIATADYFHVPLCQKALIAGKHVFVEKPLGVTIEESEQLAWEAEKSGLILQVGNMKCFDPGITFARKFIQEEMGEILALKAWYCDSFYRYDMTDNLQPLPVVSEHKKCVPRGNPKADKRRYYLMTHGSHLVDTARFLGGAIDSVRAQLVEKFGAYCWLVTVNFENGSIGQLDLTVAVRMDWHEGFQIYGEKGSVIGKTYLPWYFKSSDVECFSVKDKQYHRVLGEDAHFYKLEIEGFADAVLKKEKIRVDVHDGVADMRALVGIARSAETGGELIRLADLTGGV